MPMEIKQQSIEVRELRRVLITEIIEDQESGEFVREIRIFEERTASSPPVMGEETTQGEGRWLITLRLRSRERSNLHITAPSLEF